MCWAAMVICAGWVIYTFLGNAVPPKGHSCIAPLHLRRHHRPAVVQRSSSFKVLKKVVVTMRCARRSRMLWGRRLTNRCSGPGTIKCLAAGVDTSSASHHHRARVLTSQPAAAELNR